jgi:uncharacterized protein (DUF433 family)
LRNFGAIPRKEVGDTGGMFTGRQTGTSLSMMAACYNSGMNTILAINLIATDPAVRSGRPYIVGTTLTVADVAVAKVFWMMDADAIADHYSLTLSQVYAALAYYYDHKAEVDAGIRERRQLAAAMKENRIGSRHSPLLG